MNEIVNKLQPPVIDTYRFWVKNIYSLIKQWRQNAKTRRQLSELPEHLLEDIGVTPEEAHKESQKYFWD
ncbi:DUF1127 domain-containing protein [Vibrio mangrovi]|uniref:DUF1127 domain-containing protein n=1 Tax=Vibrio mangrovi TaxID=474394 RepID=A0A1Y6IRN9_9VIBR|nr:DUF1127 domain-containing protein [Vibrio mangrovi]MDW6001685.1 DUF1127 domain-containing protein [Vibrio mangrovi]SMS00288.1 hypothetical protein VIM7927_01538 [Vibrio mangrovi]